MRHLMTATALPVLAMLGSPVLAQTYSNETGSVTFYGQVSPTYLGYDDGDETSSELADNAHSNTRVGFWLERELATSVLKFNFETAVGLPQTSAFSQDSSPDWEWDKTKLRKVDIVWDSLSWGSISFGQGSMASDGVATIDKSGTTMVSTVTTSDTAGSYLFREDGGDLSDIALGDVYSDFDGGRRGRIRYDTPTFGGFRLAAAYGEEILNSGDDSEYYDIGAFYSNDYGSFEVSAGAGYAWKDSDGDTTERYAGSVSVLHGDTGLNGTFALGGDPDGGDYCYIKAGWITDFTPVGSTAFSADYYSGSDFQNDGSSSDAWGLQVTQNFDAHNIEAYAGFASYEFDGDGGVDYQDSSSTLAGLRWRF